MPADADARDPAAGGRTPTRDRAVRPGALLDVPLGERATFVQFSSTFCTPCRATRRVLERVVATEPGVRHVELDVADHPELGERLGIDVTPTVLLLDADGVERTRASGAPRLAQARAALRAVVGAGETGVAEPPAAQAGTGAGDPPAVPRP